MDEGAGLFGARAPVTGDAGEQESGTREERLREGLHGAHGGEGFPQTVMGSASFTETCLSMDSTCLSVSFWISFSAALQLVLGDLALLLELLDAVHGLATAGADAHPRLLGELVDRADEILAALLGEFGDAAGGSACRRRRG